MNSTIKSQQGVLKGSIRSKVFMSGIVHYPISVNIPVFNGDYIINPKSTQQILLTKDKQMTDDVTIKPIPYFETSNEEDGITIFIGSEVD